MKAIGSAFDRFADDDVCQRSLWDVRQEETSIKASKSGCDTRERKKQTFTLDSYTRVDGLSDGLLAL